MSGEKKIESRKKKKEIVLRSGKVYSLSKSEHLTCCLVDFVHVYRGNAYHQRISLSAITSAHISHSNQQTEERTTKKNENSRWHLMRSYV